MSTGPYRGDPSGPRWVCLVCYAHAATMKGLCPRCEVELLPLDDPEVREELHAEAERRMQKRQYGEYFGLSLLGFALATPLLPIFGDIFYLLSAVGLGTVAIRAYTKVRPRSALGLYAERRRRLALELSGQKALPPIGGSTTEDGDPEDLSLEATLRWLGIDLDDPSSRKR